MKGIILAGGLGTRLYPLTNIISKQLLPVYDKPMIYYPLSILMLANIKEILIISNEEFIPLYKNLLSDGALLGLNISYQVQKKPNGLAESLILAENFLNNSPCCLVLGDNLLYGNKLSETLKKSKENLSGAHIFGYEVNNPSDFGIAEFDNNNKVISIEEKPKNPKSNFAVIGLYFYDNQASYFAKTLKPSHRGELEITDLNNIYLKENKLSITKLSRGFTWLDSGTQESLLEASNFVHIIEKNQGLKIACLEEIALKKEFISKETFTKSIEKYKKSSSGKYLKKCLNYL